MIKKVRVRKLPCHKKRSKCRREWELFDVKCIRY